MNALKCIIKKIVLIIIMISTLITFFATPASYAKLDLKEGEFYYSGTTDGKYTVSDNIFAWLLEGLGDIADWLLGIMTLGVRMVFIGWTALIEKILTWALESSTGVAANGALVESSADFKAFGFLSLDPTDFTSLNDSSRNVTVEAIVYNRVAALDINIFDLTYDKTISGTGQKMVCEGCGQYVDLCVTNYNDESDIDLNTVRVDSICSCAGGPSESCIMYVKQLAAEEPMVIKIRGLVATWYNVIRLLSTAALLIVLIAVGIKMAITTIASDKALYKRMLFDWVVGTIMLFTLHYFMIFVINVNEIMVSVIEDVGSSINQINLTHMTQKEFTNSEIEQKVYEQIRTRAYDAKLSNGLIGMIMYMTLVYMAVRYTIIYLKRYFTIIVLTLMAPGIGVAYAIQKVFSGKSHALKTWMSEYIMNTVIQIVHALLYAIFISQALVLSMQSISGMIFALILMNYTMKADELFKKIFRFGGGDSLLGHTEGAADALHKNMETAKGLVIGAKPAAKMLTNTPYGIAVKALGKAGVAAGIVGVSKAASKISQEVQRNGKTQEEKAEEKYNKKLDKEMNKSFGGAKIKDGETRSEYNARRKDAADKLSARGIYKPDPIHDEALLKKGKFAIETDAASAFDEYVKKPNDPEAQKRYINSQRDYARFQEITIPSTKDVISAHLKKAGTIEDVFRVGDHKTLGQNLKAIAKGTFGTTYWDKKQRRFVTEKDAAIDQLSISSLLGFSDADKKIFKANVWEPIKSGFIGLTSIYTGLSTLVANPKMGMGLLVLGASKSARTFRRPTNIRSYQGTYTFSKFGLATMATMRNSALARAQQEADSTTVKKIESNHPGFAQDMKNGTINAVTLGVPALLGGSTLSMFGAGGLAGMMATRMMVNTSLSGNLEAMDIHARKQQKKQEKEFAQESLQIMTIQAAAEADRQRKLLNTSQPESPPDLDTETRKVLREMGYDLDSSGELQVRVKRTTNGGYVAEKESSEVILNKIETRTTAPDGTIVVEEKKITDTDVRTVYNEINQVIAEMAADGNQIDMSSEASQDKAIEMISRSLITIGILNREQNVSRLFKGGRDALVSVLKEKSNKVNDELDNAQYELERELPQDVDILDVKEAIDERLADLRSRSLTPYSVSILDIDPNDIINGIRNQREDESRRAARLAEGRVIEKISLTAEQESQLKSSLRKYANTVYSQVAISNADVVTAAKEEAKLRMTKKATRTSGAKKESKVQDALAMLVGIDLEQPKTNKKEQAEKEQAEKEINTKSSTAVINQLLKQKGKPKVTLDNGDKIVTLSSEEADAVTSMLNKLLEIKAANEIAADPLDISKGTDRYGKLKDKRTKLTLDRLEKKRELEELIRLGGVKVIDREGNIITTEDVQAKIDEIDILITKNKAEEKLAGPIFDIDDLIRNGFERR